MPDRLPGEVVGTSGLWLAFALAAANTMLRRHRRPDGRRIVRPALLALALHAAHAGEEYATGFHQRFPALLGLEPWSGAFFLSFNAAWVLAWMLAIWRIGRRPPPLAALILLWFLGIAGLVNGLAHPALALFSGGYFPGLVTAPLLGCAGLFLIVRMAAPDEH